MKDDGDKSLTIFDQPRDVKGTSILVFLSRGYTGRAMAVLASAEASEAYFLSQQVRPIHGQRVCF